MTNKDLLKEAIAEATTIREAAIANAKEALEESITPHLREMLAQKLQEMDLDEEEMERPNGTETEDGTIGGDHGNIVKEDDEEDTEETEEEEEDEEDLDPNDPDFSEKLKDLVRDIVAQETGAEEVPGEEGLEDMEDDNTIDIDTDNVDEINIDELLAELDEMNEDDGYEKVKEVPGKGTNSYSRKLSSKRDDTSGTPGDGYMEEEVDENWGGGAAAGNFSVKKGQKDEGDLDKWIAAIATKTGQTVKSLKDKIMGTSSSQATQTSEDLQEALKAVKILRNQLQEVNLLNAKLLYVNKVFKSNNLSEGQKVNVIAAFDKAETVKEVKLVFETVSKNVVVKKPTTVKEHRSFASKATGMTAAPKKEIISEVSEQVLRMQKLAGIIK